MTARRHAHCSLFNIHLDFLYDFILLLDCLCGFLLVMLEGDITLLLAGVLAQRQLFGREQFCLGLARERWEALSAITLPITGRTFRKAFADFVSIAPRSLE